MNRQESALEAHAEYRAGGYRSVPIRLDKIIDDRGAAKKRPRFPGGSWKTAESANVERVVEDGYVDLALICSNIVALDFDCAEDETDDEIRARVREAWQQFGLDGATVQKSGRGYHLILKTPPGEWERNTRPPPMIDEARTGDPEQGGGLLIFAPPSWHPVAERHYERFGKLVRVGELPECPVELLRPRGLPDPSESRPVAESLKSFIADINRQQRGVGRGDWQTLDIVGLFREAGMYHGQLRGRKHGVRCPWEAEHTTGSDGSDTAVFEAQPGRGPGFRCQHEHCRFRDIRDVRAFFGPEAVDRHCAGMYRRAA